MNYFTNVFRMKATSHKGGRRGRVVDRRKRSALQAVALLLLQPLHGVRPATTNVAEIAFPVDVPGTTDMRKGTKSSMSSIPRICSFI